jgi:hypothetical protein
MLTPCAPARRPFNPWLALTVAALALVPACGDDDDATNTADAADTVGTTGTTSATDTGTTGATETTGTTDTSDTTETTGTSGTDTGGTSGTDTGGTTEPETDTDTDTGTGTDTDTDTTEDTGPFATEFTVVELDPGAPITTRIAAQACAGLYNRELGGSAFVRTDTSDDQWLEQLDLDAAKTLTPDDFITECRAKFPKCVRYSYDDQQILTPNIITAAAALDAVPLDVNMAAAAGCTDVAFDAIAEFKDNATPLLATKLTFEKFGAQTTGLAMLNPGYDTSGANNPDPPVVGDLSWGLIDFVFERKLFVVFLVNGCIEGNPERELLSDIVNGGQWPSLLGVFGYNNSWNVFGGYFYEAQTNCLASANMGHIATETNNLSFFSTRRPAIKDVSELPRNPIDTPVYDKTKTYIAFVIGDGDNIAFVMRSRKDWLRQRLAECADGGTCPPLSWSMSPHLVRLAPDVLKWYYTASAQTGHDYFVLPPSGHLYAYPSSLNLSAQEAFVTATEKDARMLGVTGVVHWDEAGTWDDALKVFLPKYAKTDGAIRGAFAVNVPYITDPFPWPKTESYRIVTGKDGGKLAVFQQREWRGVSGSGKFTKTPAQMADEIGGYPKGTVTWMYMTSDGGLTLDNSYAELIKILPSHVELVSTDSAARLAIEAAAAK